MTWKSHIAITYCAGLAATLNPTSAAIISLGSTLPDKIEIVFPILKHRGNSHSLSLWVAVLVLSSSLSLLWPQAISLSYILLGGVAHLLQDMLSVRGIPLGIQTRTLRSPQVRIPLYRTRTFSELAVAFILCLCFLTIAYFRSPDVHFN